MTKADIVSEIAKSTGVEKMQVQTIVEAFMESVKDSLIQNNNVYLRGFGSFIVKKRAKKVPRNISKNTTITIPSLPLMEFCKTVIPASSDQARPLRITTFSFFKPVMPSCYLFLPQQFLYFLPLPQGQGSLG